MKSKIKKVIFPAIHSEKGVALLMILTTITILSALLVDFTFDTKINKLKVENIQDKTQAKLNAEAGLKMAIARLKLYKEAFNILEKNKDLKKMVGESANQIWSLPFIYPIPETKDMNIVQRTALKEFKDNTLIQGELQVTIQNISNKLNINLLRISKFKEKKNTNEDQFEQYSAAEDNTFSIETHLTELLSDSLERKKEQDEEFNDLYADRDPKRLISAIKHFVSDKESYEDEFSQEFTSSYSNREVTPKYAPLSSISEILLIEGWDQNILDLIKDEITVHGVIMIDLNKITEKSLRIMIPEIDEDQSKAFFKYRDDPKDPHYFESIEDFKKYIVGIGQIMESGAFDQMINKYKKAGVKFGASGSLFQIISKGSFGRANYSLVAYITLPARPTPKKQTKKDSKKEKELMTDEDYDKLYDEELNDEEGKAKETKSDKKDQKKDKKQPLQLMNPRTVEIIIS